MDRGKLRETLKSPSVVVLLAGNSVDADFFCLGANTAADRCRLKFDHISDSYIAQCRTCLADQEQELRTIQRSIEVLEAHFDGKASGHHS